MLMSDKTWACTLRNKALINMLINMFFIQAHPNRIGFEPFTFGLHCQSM